MAVVLSMRIPGLTSDRYNQAIAELELDASPPAGLILHVVSESVGSVNVLEIWQTPQTAESFVESRLREVMARHGVEDPLAYRLDALYNLYAPEMDIVERIGASSVAGRGFRSGSIAG